MVDLVGVPWPPALQFLESDRFLHLLCSLIEAQLALLPVWPLLAITTPHVLEGSWEDGVLQWKVQGRAFAGKQEAES